MSPQNAEAPILHPNTMFTSLIRSIVPLASKSFNEYPVEVLLPASNTQRAGVETESLKATSAGIVYDEDAVKIFFLNYLIIAQKNLIFEFDFLNEWFQTLFEQFLEMHFSCL